MNVSLSVTSQAGEDRMDILERSSRDSVIERRNFFMGLWAGQLLGYEGDDLAIYAGEIMASDLAEPGPADVIARIVRDFAGQGVAVSEREVGDRLAQTERLVRAELLSTD
ncbi:MAG: ATPase inhibitor subunit zeta [Beijerinckiaceae bacterium]